MLKTKLKFILFLLVLSLFSSFALAKEVDLYDQPTTNAKIVGKIDLAAGIVPIFTPKDSTWVKVGDPRNGNVGWIKSSDLSNNGSTAVTFTQKITNNGQAPQTYQVLQVGEPKKLTPQETQAMVQRMQMEQKSIEESARKAMQNMWDSMHLMQQQWNMILNMPIVAPAVVSPMENPQTAPTPNNAKTTGAPTKK